jgi:hypothetical protein
VTHYGHRIKVDFKMYNSSLPFENEHILRIKISSRFIEMEECKIAYEAYPV